MISLETWLPQSRKTRTVAPKCRPGAATSRHVYGIHDDQRAGVGKLGGDAYSLACSLHCGGSLYSHDHISCIVDFNKVGRLLQGGGK